MVEAAALLDRAHAQVTETDMGYGAARQAARDAGWAPAQLRGMGYTAPPTPGTNRAVGSGYAKLTPSLRPPPRFPTKGADRARAGGATAPAPGRPRAERGQVPLGSHAAVGSVQSAVLHRANRDAAYRASPGR